MSRVLPRKGTSLDKRIRTRGKNFQGLKVGRSLFLRICLLFYCSTWLTPVRSCLRRVVRLSPRGRRALFDGTNLGSVVLG